jgi:restriction system protein
MNPFVDESALAAVIEALLSLWYVWLLAAAVGLVRLLLRQNEQRTLSRAGIAEIDAMDGRAFEQRLAALFRSLGYRVEETRYRGDYGADLVVAKAGVRTVVQAKRWTKNVGLKAVQEAHAAAALYRCSRSMVVTNRYYSRQARELARVNNVQLWDRDDLVRALVAAGA